MHKWKSFSLLWYSQIVLTDCFLPFKSDDQGSASFKPFDPLGAGGGSGGEYLFSNMDFISFWAEVLCAMCKFWFKVIFWHGFSVLRLIFEVSPIIWVLSLTCEIWCVFFFPFLWFLSVGEKIGWVQQQHQRRVIGGMLEAHLLEGKVIDFIFRPLSSLCLNALSGFWLIAKVQSGYLSDLAVYLCCLFSCLSFDFCDQFEVTGCDLMLMRESLFGRQMV